MICDTIMHKKITSCEYKIIPDFHVKKHKSKRSNKLGFADRQAPFGACFPVNPDTFGH